MVNPRIVLLGLLLMQLACYAQIDSSKNELLRPREGYIQSTDGVQLFYRLLGNGTDTLIVIHGGPGFTMNYFLEDLSPLAQHHVLLFYDQRGSGRSTLVSDSLSLQASKFVDDVNAIRDHFDLGKLQLLGHSWGSAVVALYTMKYPERVSKIVGVGVLPLQQHQLTEAFNNMAASRDSVTLRRMGELREVRLSQPEKKEACQEYYELWFEKFFADPTSARRSKGDFCAGTPESRHNAIHHVGRFTMASLGKWDWREPLRRVSIPALIIHGTLDPLPKEGAVAWATALPKARLLLYEGIGHFPYLETPDRFFREVGEFLRQR